MKMSYALKLLKEYIIWLQMKILDFDLIVRNKKNYAKVLEIEFLNWAKPDEVIMKYFAFLQTIIF